MATDKPRFSITLTEELAKKVNDYQHNMHYATQTKAIVDLIQRGAATLGLSLPEINEVESSDFSEYETDIIKKYRSLDPYGQKAVLAILNLELERVEVQDKSAENVVELNEISATPFAARNGGLQPSNPTRERHLRCLEKALAEEDGEND